MYFRKSKKTNEVEIMESDVIELMTEMKEGIEGVSDAELQNFLDDILKQTGEDDVFSALDEISTNSHRIIGDL